MNRIKELRIEKGLLQSDIAKYIKKSERIVGFYESGERDPNTDTLLKLSELFDVSIDYILGKSNFKNYKKFYFNTERRNPGHKMIFSGFPLRTP